MRASYIENSLQKKSDLFKKTGLREGNGYLTIPKKPRISYSSSNVKNIERELCGVGIYPVLRI